MTSHHVKRFVIAIVDMAILAAILHGILTRHGSASPEVLTIAVVYLFGRMDRDE